MNDAPRGDSADSERIRTNNPEQLRTLSNTLGVSRAELSRSESSQRWGADWTRFARI